MAAPAVSSSDLVAVAQSYSIPPAILQGLMSAEGSASAFGLPTATLAAYNLTAAQAAANPLLALETAARSLSQSFNEYGSWDQTLSAYLTGDPHAYQSPTSSIGGQVYSILGAAAVNPTLGLSGYHPASVNDFIGGSDAFLHELQTMSTSGGVVSPQVEANYRSVSSTVAFTSLPGSTAVASNPTVAAAMQAVLTAAGIPVTAANVALLSTMARGEGMPLGDFNWLATTSGQGTDINSVGVKAFSSSQAGVQATAQTLLNGNYSQMVKLMQSGASLSQMAQDPGVQANLRTWQGGSDEDVNLLLGEQNVPGTPIAATTQAPVTAAAATQSTGAGPTPKTPPTPPAQVGTFAAQLQAAGISPQAFSQWFPVVAQERRRLLASKGTSVSDFVTTYQQLQAAGQPISETSISNLLSSQPHPTFPNVSIANFNKAQSLATLHSMLHTNQVPTASETAMLASSGAGWKEMSDYYQTKKAWLNQAQTAQPAQRAAPAGGSNILPMPKPKAPTAPAPAAPAAPVSRGVRDKLLAMR